MFTLRQNIILVLVITLVLVGGVRGEPQYTDTPAVSATAMPYGGTVITDESQAPVTPLFCEASSVAGSNTGWAQTTPGHLRASSAIANAAEGWNNSQGVCLFVDHFRLDNPQMPPNSSGVFFFRFYMTGTMRIKASDIFGKAMVQVGAFKINHDPQAAQINFGQVNGVATLYAASGGEGNPGDNILAWPDGETRVYGTTTTQVGGYYVIQVGIPVVFIFQNMPINTTPPVDDWRNQLEVRMSVVSFSNATCDFSSTFEFAPQNPIIPDPDNAAMPVTGWDMGTASDEISLPPQLTIATSTGSGEAAFLAEQGTIYGLGALTLADFPEGLTDGNFAHGWFEMEVDLLESASQCDVAISLPAGLDEGATWWFHDGVGWESIALDNSAGDARVVLPVMDNGYGDGDPTQGVIYLAGGISDEEPLPAMLSVFIAEWRTGGVELSWRAPGANPGSLRLEAFLEGVTWQVPLTSDGRGGYTARDDTADLYGGGTVRYDLSFDGMLLDSRTVELPNLTAAHLDLIAPNPFNPRVEIAYTVARGTGNLELSIYDLQGRRMVTLVNGEQGPGQHVAEWQGLDASGQAVPSGTYLVRLATEQRVESRKIMLVR